MDQVQVPDDRFVLAFYGLAPSQEAGERFFRTAEQWMETLGYPADSMGVVGTGHSGRVGEYRRTKSTLEKRGFVGVESFSMYASTPAAQIPGMEYFASACFSGSRDDGGYVAVAVPSETAASAVWLQFSRKIAQDVRPAYGIGFVRALHLGPIKYAMGLCQGLGVGLTGQADEEARRISRWSDMGMPKQVYRDGLLRDVYRWNFLARTQLNRPVAGTTLEHWIGQHSRRGTVTPFAADLWLWEVQDGEVTELRRSLHEGGVIYDWRKLL